MLANIIFQSDWYLHLIASFFLFLAFYSFEVKYFKKPVKGRLIFLQIFLANLIDLDHLLSSPIYQEGRCSINNHLLHSWYFFPLYIFGLLSRFRYFFSSLILHLLIDYLACI